MGLNVIGAGLGRTGTLSLKRALEQLGFGPCYHSLDSNVAEVERLHSALNRDPPDLDEAFGPYNAAVDWPAYGIYKELSQTYPSAKVILTTREPSALVRSWQTLFQELEHFPPGPEESQFARRLAFQGSLASPNPGPDAILAFIERHNTEVQRTIPSDRLCVFDIKQGWKPLCQFLDVPVPDVDFPHANSKNDLPLLLARLWQVNSVNNNKT